MPPGRSDPILPPVRNSFANERRVADRVQAMKDWIPQIVIGIIVTVVGTVIANAIVGGHGGKHFFSGGSHFTAPGRR